MKGRSRTLSRAFVAVLCTGSIPVASAQITLDGTMGPAGALAGPHYQIPAAFGTQVGGNLFHSFRLFNVGAAQSATFSGPGSVSNIVGRVTGGSFSNIDGAIRSTIQGANLFLVNPAGILFGPNASLSVSGVFHASTAHYIALGTSGRFDAVNPNGTVLSSAPPSAFGFVSNTVRPIQLSGARLQSLTPGAGLSLVAGDVTLIGAQLAAVAGPVSITSVAGPGEVSLTSAGPIPAPGVLRGTIAMVNGSLAGTLSGGLASPPGKVGIRGGTLVLVDSQILSDNGASIGAADMTVDATREVSLERASIVSVSRAAGDGALLSIATPSAAPKSGSRIASVALGAGASGDVTIDAARVTVATGAGITTSAAAGGRSGNVTVRAQDSLHISGRDADGSSSFIGTSGGGAGRAGDVSITAPFVALDRGQVGSISTAGGPAGNVAVKAGRLAMTEGAQLTVRSAGGEGGKISVSAAEAISISRSEAAFSPTAETGIFTTAQGAGRGGDIALSTPQLGLSDGVIQAKTESTGAGGNVSLDVGRLTLDRGSRVDLSSSAQGHAGTLTVVASESVSASGQNISARHSALAGFSTGSGRGGSIVVRAPQVSLDRNGSILAETSGAGAPGTVTIVAEHVAVAGFGQVSSSTAGAGTGGGVTIEATEEISATGGGSIFGTAFGSGRGSDVSLKAPLIVLDGGGISTRSSGSGAAGDIVLEADRVIVSGGSQVDLNTQGPGAAGNLTVRASESLSVVTLTSGGPSGFFSRTLGSGRGGDIRIIAPAVSVDNAAIRADTAASGAAGSIVIEAARLTVANGGQIDSSTASSGSAGKVAITATESIEVSGRNTFQPSNIINATLGSGSAGEITIAAPRVVVADAFISAETRGDGNAGNITLQAGRLTMRDGGQIRSTSTGSGAGGRIHVAASEAVEISSADATGADAGLFGATQASGRGGEILLTAPMLTMSGGVISTSAAGTGPAGRVSVVVPRVAIDRGVVSAGTLGAGAAGGVSITARSISLTGGTVIESSSSGDGAAGTLRIDATESIDIADGPSAQSSGVVTEALRSGRGGDIFLSAPSVNIANAQVSASSAGAGDAGRVFVDAARLSVTRGGQIASSTSASGVGGRVTVRASESVTVSGEGRTDNQTLIASGASGTGSAGEIDITTPSFELARGFISAQTSSSGTAGTINIASGRVLLRDGGQVSSTTSGVGAGGSVSVVASESIEIKSPSTAAGGAGVFGSTQGPGRGGDIALAAPRVTLSGGRVSSTASSSGAAGRIDLRGARIVLEKGGTVDSSSRGGSGDAGTVNITAAESLELAGRDADGVASNVSSLSQGSGAAGTISVRSRNVSLADGAQISTSSSGSGAGGEIDIVASQMVSLSGASISASSSGAGDAGSIFIDAGRSLTLTGSAITTEASRADGGNIEIMAIDLLRLTDSEITTSVGTGSGNGGNITIDPVFVILDSSRIIANAFGGNGGNIRIITNALLQTGDSIISASSELGIEGTIEISAPESDLAGGLAALPGGLFDSSLLLRESCSARAGRGGNSFTGVGHGGLPERPGTLAFSSYAQRPAAAARHSAPLFALAASFENACPH